MPSCHPIRIRQHTVSDANGLRVEVFRLALPDGAWPVFDSMNTFLVKFIIRVVVGFHLLCVAVCGNAGVVVTENLFRVQPPGSPLISTVANPASQRAIVSWRLMPQTPPLNKEI
jgi:hypothetical protein